MKILHIITQFIKSAGTSVFCGEVCNGLAHAGHDVTLALLDPDRTDYYVVNPSVKTISIDSMMSGGADVRPDVIHLHVLWQPIMRRIFSWARQTGAPIVWSPHGTLTSWAMRYHWWKKWPVWWLYQKRDLMSAALLHATAESEVEDFRRMGLKNRVCIAPLGVNLPEFNERTISGKDAVRTLLFVSRVQRKKGLLNLVRAWAMIPDHVRKGWKVRIVGPDQEGHAAEVTALSRECGVEKSIEIVGPRYGADLDAEYSSAQLFVLPTYSENFGSVVVEALAHGLPVITTKGAPWGELETSHCGWWIDIGVEPLTKALQLAMSLEDGERHGMGVRGRGLVEEKYTWSAVVKAMERAYASVLSDAR